MQQSLTQYPIIVLQKGKDEAIKRFHPWIFSGAIKTLPAKLEAGTIVTVKSSQDQFLGVGFYEAGNIAVKMLSFSEELIGAAFWVKKIHAAFSVRKQLGLIGNASITAYRLVHSEGDGLPGLVVDVYGKTAVLQAQTLGMYKQRQLIANALMQVMEEKLEAVYNKSADALERMGVNSEADAYLIGKATENTIIENNAMFLIDWEQGQKTGFFIDQRDNRQLLQQLCLNKNVLNTFSYSGGFSVYALKGGANKVVSVDSSKRAIELCDKNVALNGFDAQKHASVCIDAKKYLEQLQGNEFDVMVLDPPAFAKNHHSKHKGLQGYKFINYQAIKKIKSGGMLFTFSCSQAVDRQAFQSIVMAAAIEAKRPVKVLYHLSQSADHPSSIYHPEGSYLKGLVLEIE